MGVEGGHVHYLLHETTVEIANVVSNNLVGLRRLDAYAVLRRFQTPSFLDDSL